MTEQEKTHYRKAFDSPYLSSQDITEPIVLTISRVELLPDKSKKTTDKFNTAYFTEKEIRPGEILKPLILNATNSRTMRNLTGSHFIDDWNNVPVTIYVDPNVRFGRDVVEGLRVSKEKPRLSKPELVPDTPQWERAVESFGKTGTFDAVLKHMQISDANKELIADRAMEASDGVG